MSGRVEDDQQICRVQVAIRNSADRYMSSSGAFTSTSQSWQTAFLNSPGSPGSNFSYTTPAIPDDAYTVLVRGIDQHDFVTPVPSERNVTVTGPVGNLPPVADFSVSCVENVCSFDARSSTDENAPTLTYSWNFGNGSGSGPVPVRTYTSADTYSVTVTATDEYGLSHTSPPQNDHDRRTGRQRRTDPGAQSAVVRTVVVQLLQRRIRGPQHRRLVHPPLGLR